MPRKSADLIPVPKRLALNIETLRDLHNSNASYFPTPLAINFTEQVASAALRGGRAHSLQGAYGAGKSSLAIYALNQLACATKTFKPNPRLGKNHAASVPPSAAKVRKRGGLLSVPVVGAVAPLATRITAGLKRAAVDYKGTRPAALKTLKKLEPGSIDDNQLLNLLSDLARDIAGHDKAGILLVIDEFGRHLEYMLARGDLTDLHLLQSLAEGTGDPRSPFSLVIVQHHGLEHYSSRFLSEQKAEWEKVRGRFQETTLNNTETDTANIIGSILAQASVSKHARTLHFARSWNQKISFPVLRDKKFLAAATGCAPLHPLSIVLLSRLARLLGQNDRTVADWLASELDTGFATSANRAGKDWVLPYTLFEHFFSDIQHVPSNTVLASRFSTIHSAYARLNEQDCAETVSLLQTIAMLNFCSGGGLVADTPTLAACLPAKFPLKKSLQTLIDKSLVIHRKHRGEFCIWEGSDYDISGRINAIAQNLRISAAEILNRRTDRKILAHAHLVRTGNHRTAQLLWLDANTSIPAPSDAPRILIWLDKPFPSNCKASKIDVWGLLKPEGLDLLLRDTACIQHLLDSDEKLQLDTVANGEIRRQLEFLEEKIDARISDSLDSDITWRVGTKPYKNLQQAVSEAMDKAYPKALILHNELINRNRVSGPITAAIRMLVENIYQHSAVENLGIDKFPAERIIYESLLKGKHIHVRNKNGAASWRITLDQQDIDKDLNNIVTEITNQFLNGESGKPQELARVLSILAASPYGLKRIPALLLCMIFLLVHRDRTELYEDGLYLPNWGPQTLVRMIRAPETFAVAVASRSTVSEGAMNKYRSALAGKPGAGANTPINLARDLLLRYERLSIHARQTDAVSEQTRKFRRALSVAKSPADMLFRTIPAALDYDTFPDKTAPRNTYFTRIQQVIKELENSDSNLQTRFSDIMQQLCNCRTLAQARKQVIRQAKKVLEESRMYHAHEQFLGTIVSGVSLNALDWLASVMDTGLGINTPIDAWSDAQAAHAEFSFRRNLIGLQQSASALEKFASNPEKLVFVVWPPSSKLLGKPKIKQLEALLKDMPPEQISPLLLNLAKHYNGRK